MEWATVKEIAEIWGMTTRRVQFLCANERVVGAQKLGDIWVVPLGTPKPIDGRTKAARESKIKERKNAGNKHKCIPDNGK